MSCLSPNVSVLPLSVKAFPSKQVSLKYLNTSVSISALGNRLWTFTLGGTSSISTLTQVIQYDPTCRIPNGASNVPLRQITFDGPVQGTIIVNNTSLGISSSSSSLVSYEWDASTTTMTLTLNLCGLFSESVLDIYANLEIKDTFHPYEGTPTLGFYLWTYAKSNETFSVHTQVTSSDFSQYPPQTYNCQNLTSTFSDPNDYSWVPENADFCVAFSGEENPETAYQLSQPLLPYMKGSGKYICLGGGQTQWTVSIITPIVVALQNNVFVGFNGICWDVENCVVSNEVRDAFLNAFEISHQSGLKNILTTSHTGPYGVGPTDLPTVMSWFFSSPYLDIISPQLYTCDYGTCSEYDSSSGLLWVNPSSSVTTFTTLYNGRTNPDLQILPSVFSNISLNGFYDLFLTGGTNEGRPPTDFYGSYLPLTFTQDHGVSNFFNTILGIPSSGSIQFSNGQVSLNSTVYSCDNDPQCAPIFPPV